MCLLCGPTAPLPLCARCAVRGSVDWEERGDQFWGRALFLTFREALLSPRRLGKRLGGAERMGWASLYAVCCALLGGVPLSVLLAALMLTVADPLTLGMRSTSLLSSAVFLVLFAVGTASALPLLLLGFAGLVLGVARLFAVDVRFDVLLRASAYGLSLLAVPLFGPLLLPLGLIIMLTCVHGALSAATSSTRASACLLCVLLLLSALWLVCFVG